MNRKGLPKSRATDFEESYVDEAHIQAFKDALEGDDLVLDELNSGTISPAQSIGSGTSRLTASSMRVRKVSAMSDFAPISIRVKKRKRKPLSAVDRKQEWMFILLRWPLLTLLLLFIFVVFGAYVGTRQCVNAWERLFAWRGMKGRLRKRLRSAQNYEQWKSAAKTLDEYLQFDLWKREDEDSYYDWRLVKKVCLSLRAHREEEDTRGLMAILNTSMRANFGGTESARLYSETYYGTKNVVEAYIKEVQLSLSHVRKSTKVSLEEKRQFFKSCNINFGSSALCLSGGASFGYYHFGIVKALLDADYLPRVIAGTSAGGLVAALVCTRKDEELRDLLVPQLADKLNACSDPFSVWFQRFRRTGARFDTVDWARKACYFTRGSLTFKEAWQRTGRVLNVSVIPFDQHSPTKLLNYLTAPDTVIWSALIASAAVPGILNPVVLMQKTALGSIIPWSWGSRFKDGSLRVDIPLQALNLYFNVTHPVVSQVNPHVHLFFFAPRGSAGKPVAHRKGKGWRGGFLLSAAEQWLKLELTKNFKFIRDLELLPQLLGQDWSSVFLQRFDGAVTIWPRTRILDWFHILSDPDREDLARMMRAGQFVTWPKIHMIENRMRLEREIQRGRQAVRQAHQRDRPDIEESLNLRSDDVWRKGDRRGDDELPIESDAERDFAEGSRRFFKRTHSNLDKVASPLGQPTDYAGKSEDMFPSRPRLSTVLSNGGGTADDEGGPAEAVMSSEPPQPQTLHPLTRSRSSSSFLSRWRNTSFPTLPNPFGYNSRARGSIPMEYQREVVQQQQQDLWSSDSSSEIEF